MGKKKKKTDLISQFYINEQTNRLLIQMMKKSVSKLIKDFFFFNLNIKQLITMSF